jgi:hypothetical protein
MPGSDAIDEKGRNLRATVTSLLRLPTSTMPWWNAGRLLNQNRGVFGLNLLSWWKREGGMDRITKPLLADLGTGRLAPVVAKAFPFDAPATPTATSPAQHRQGRPHPDLSRVNRSRHPGKSATQL